MSDTPSYVIVGRGRWAARMREILSGEGRRVASIAEARRLPAEDEAVYESRLAASFIDSRAQVAWLCVPPGPHIPVMLRAALNADLDAIVEKPWLCLAAETKALQEIARSPRRLIAIHYEYCFLREVEAWRKKFFGGAGLSFGGRLNIGRPDHLGLPPIDNLGSHLVAIRNHAVPEAAFEKIECGYEKRDERVVWLSRGGERIASIDMLAGREPIIQRFVRAFEAARAGGAFPLGLEFALRVAEDVAALKR